jgi:hypothetical protein
MSQKNIPDSDNVLRWAKNAHLVKNHDGKVIGCYHVLFTLRTDQEFIDRKGKKEDFLSVNWLEYFTGTQDEQLNAAVSEFKSKRGNKLPKNSYFTQLNVGELKELCLKHSAKVRVVHESTKDSHSAIRQLPQDKTMLFDDLCTAASKSLIPATKFACK